MKSKQISTWILIMAMLAGFEINAQSKAQDLPRFENPFDDNSTKSHQDNSSTVKTKASKQEVRHFKFKKGSFFENITAEKLSLSQLLENFNLYSDLGQDHNFQVESITDAGGDHRQKAILKQSYKGYKVDESTVIVHLKDGLVQTVSGRIQKFSNLSLDITLNRDRATALAKEYLGVEQVIQTYPVETVITSVPSTEQTSRHLAYKVRIDSDQPFEMCYVFIDAQNGNILNKVNLIAHADVNGTAQTLYSGNQNIICDSLPNGTFRLRETGRKIQTFNASQSVNYDSTGFIGATDFVNNSSNWTTVPKLESFTIDSVAQGWWYTMFADEYPDLYLIIKDGNNQPVDTTSIQYQKHPTVTWQNMGILLTDPPYTVEVWDDDTYSDDFGGSYTISSTPGSQSWSGNGNKGTYSVSSGGHPALDVHWGMEVTYDFYLNVLGRHSYDDSGSVIKNYLNSPLTRPNQGKSPNNAFAMPPPYNLMVFGVGDGNIMNPVVALDVEGHEFTHLVVNKNGNGGLTYQGESGALNESFADIMGTCIEFYSGVNPDWQIGEDVFINRPQLRSMTNPKSENQPDTYQGTNWANPNNLNYDHGGVHVNSGVQNYWFYLLSVGGSGTNDLGNAYTVSGIGINDAQDIAYRNLTHYLTSNATFYDAYQGSLQAADDLFGNPSAQYDAVKQAWYAVGIGSNPNSFCNDTTYFSAPTNTFSDGSASADYQNNANCQWVISPPGATQITLNFNSFRVESNNDTVLVYDGPNDTYPLLGSFWGSTIPASLSTSPGTGAMTVKFVTNGSVADSGWSASYTSTGSAASCNGGTVLTAATDTFSDGSGMGNYGTNQLCYWFIGPPCANSVSLSFSQFNTESGADGVIVFDDWDASNQLGIYSGSSIPGNITSSTGRMLVIFTSDFSNNNPGFTANYTSTGSGYCSGTTNLLSSDWDSISDGSGSNNYCDNSNCEWLIQPPQATSVTLQFTEFDLEEAAPDGNPYDVVEVYDGTSSAAPLLGTYTGKNIPHSVTAHSGSMFIRFNSDMSVNGKGWQAYYTSTQNSFCSGNTTLTATTDTFSDGSNADVYANNSDCNWLIQPPNAGSISLSFTEFDTELNYDGVIVYDGQDTTAPVIAQHSGNTLPAPLTSSGGSLFVRFLSDVALRDSGWSAIYTSSGIGLEEESLLNGLTVFPNPTRGAFTVHSDLEDDIAVKVLDVSGRKVFHNHVISEGDTRINAGNLSRGVYILEFTLKEEKAVKRLVIQ